MENHLARCCGTAMNGFAETSYNTSGSQNSLKTASLLTAPGGKSESPRFLNALFTSAISLSFRVENTARTLAGKEVLVGHMNRRRRR